MTQIGLHALIIMHGHHKIDFQFIIITIWNCKLSLRDSKWKYNAVLKYN